MPDRQHQASRITKNIWKWMVELLYTCVFSFFPFFLPTFLLSFILSLTSWTTWVVRVRAQQSSNKLLWVLFSKDYLFPPHNHVSLFCQKLKFVAACRWMCFCMEEIAFHIKPNSDGIKRTMMNLSNVHRIHQGWPGFTPEQAHWYCVKQSKKREADELSNKLMGISLLN